VAVGRRGHGPEERAFAMKLGQNTLEKILYWACWLFMAELVIYLLLTYL